MSKVVVDTEACVVCGDCSLICPVSVYNVSPPPCQNACPINTDISANIASIVRGRFDEALASLSQFNPLPGITGRVCTHPCERECRRSEIDESVAIQALERFTADHGQDYQPGLVGARVERIAVIGSGPAGLMAAHDLASLGYQVTIFESLPVAGGLLSAGIPEYRLPKEIVRREIARVEKLGVDIRLNTPVGEKDITIEALFEQGYKAILVAIGTHHSFKLDIPGEDEFQGVEDSMSLLRQVNLDGKGHLAGKAIVVGGGNAAVDSARTLLRLGCDKVDIVYRRSQREMPAIASEVVEAEREGVKIHYLVTPSRISGKDGKVTGLECLRTELGEPDASGRRIPIPVKGSEFHMEADLIISAIGQKPDLSLWREGSRVGVSGDLITVDRDTMATTMPGIFAAGDVVTGPGTVIDAMAAGRGAAAAIDKYLRGQNLKQTGDEAKATRREEAAVTWWQETGKSKRPKIPELSTAKRQGNFDEIILGMTKELAAKEVRRCLGCDIFAYNDLDSCCGDSCRCCQYHCWKGAIKVY